MSGHEFEPEFDGPPPRDVPAELRAGPFARGRRNAVLGWSAAGVVLLGLSFVPFFARWGQFVLPLAYCDWIGAALVLVGFGLMVYHAVSPGAFRYVTHGLPVAGRILALELRPTAYHNGQANAFRYFAVVETADPDSGEPQQVELPSDQLSAAFKENWDVSYRVGDTVTLVCLPDRPDSSLRLYGFLGLRPDVGLVRRDAKPVESPVTNALKIALVVGLFGGMVWNLYALVNFQPVEFTAGQGIVAAVGAVVVGVPFLVGVAIEERRARAKLVAKNEAAAEAGGATEVVPSGVFRVWWLAVIVALGAPLLGGMTVICGAWTLNVWLDDSPPRYRPVIVTNARHTTHNGIFRTYKLDYRFLDDPAAEKHEYSTGPEELDRLKFPLGRADFRAGGFGWPWLRSIEPVLVRGDPPNP